MAPKKNAAEHRADKHNVVLKSYLLAYNLLACLGWSYVLVSLLNHLLVPSPLSSPAPQHPQTQTTPTSTLTNLLAQIPYLNRSPYFFPQPSPVAAHIQSRLPPVLASYLLRARTAYASVGAPTAWVQTLALLEIVHALTGAVRSSALTTGMQVFSRVVLVWGIAERYEVVRTNPLYASMVLAWSLTEVPRYAFYLLSLNGAPPRALLYVRYTTFFLLYPIGAASEAFLIYATLPPTSPYPERGWRAVVWGIWTLGDYVRGLLFLVWWPSLYVLYTHMIKQRRKVLGGGKTLGSRKTQ